MGIVWSLVRILYVADVVFLAAVLALRGGPSPDGDFVRGFIGVILLNVCCVLVGWAFIPAPKKASTAPKELPAVPSEPPQPAFDYRADVHTIYGQDSLEDFLDRRWKARLNGMVLPKPMKKSPRKHAFEDKWEVIATDEDFATNSLVYTEIRGMKLSFTLESPVEIDMTFKIFGHTFGTQIGLRVDGVDYEGPCIGDRLGLVTPLEMTRRHRLSAGFHAVAAVVRQSMDAGVAAIVVKRSDMPAVLVAKRA